VSTHVSTNNMSIHVSTRLSIHVSTRLSIHVSTYLYPAR
jgi:hypothetical protein